MRVSLSGLSVGLRALGAAVSALSCSGSRSRAGRRSIAWASEICGGAEMWGWRSDGWGGGTAVVVGMGAGVVAGGGSGIREAAVVVAGSAAGFGGG